MGYAVLSAALIVQTALGMLPGFGREERTPRPPRDLATRNDRVAQLRDLLQERGPNAGRQNPGALRLEGEFMIDTSIVPVPSSADEWYADAASDGNGWFVTWLGGDGQTAFGARFSAGGVLIDTIPVRISPEGSYAGSPRVAFNGTDYLVAWSDQGTWQVVITRVTTGGAVRDSVPIPLGVGQDPAIAAAGETCLVAWGRYDLSQDVYAARVTASGIVLDPDGFPVARDDSADEGSPAVAASGSGFLVAWTSTVFDTLGYELDVRAARVGLNGQVLDTVPIPVADKGGWVESGPAVAFTQDKYLVAWIRDTVYDFAACVESRRLTMDGVIVDTAVIRLPAGNGPAWGVAATADSANFLLIWESIDSLTLVNAVFAARVSFGGRVLDTVPVQLSDNGSYAYAGRVARGPGAFLGVWSDFPGMSSDIRAARVSPQGAVLEPGGVLVSYGADEQRWPRVAAGSSNALAVWLAQREQGYALRAGRVSPTGAVLDPRGFDVSSGPCYEFPAGIAFGANVYLVAWTDLRPGAAGLYAARVIPEGVVLDSGGILVRMANRAPLAPHVAFDGTNFLVTWSEVDTLSMESAIRAARVAPDGTVLDPEPITVADEDPEQVLSVAVFNGESYIVTWAASDWMEYDLKFKRLRPDGVLLDTVARILSSAEDMQFWQSGATSGETTLFVWMDMRSGWNFDIYAARVDRSGRVLDEDGRLVSTEGPDEGYPGIVRAGAGYCGFWVRYDYDSAGVAGAWLRPDGTVEEEFHVVGIAAGFVSPVVFPGGELLVAWDGWAGEYLRRRYDCVRVWAKLGPFGSGVEAEEQAGLMQNRLPTIVRNVLYLPAARAGEYTGTSLLDAAGRKVMLLQPGANDVRRLAPGVYFVMEQAVGVGRTASHGRKVVKTGD